MQVTGAAKNQAPRSYDKKGYEKFKFAKTEYKLSLPFVIYADF